MKANQTMKKDQKATDALFPNSLKGIRENAELDMSIWGNICGVSKQTIRRWERDGESIPIYYEMLYDFLKQAKDSCPDIGYRLTKSVMQRGPHGGLWLLLSTHYGTAFDEYLIAPIARGKTQDLDTHGNLYDVDSQDENIKPAAKKTAAKKPAAKKPAAKKTAAKKQAKK